MQAAITSHGEGRAGEPRFHRAILTSVGTGMARRAAVSPPGGAPAQPFSVTMVLPNPPSSGGEKRKLLHDGEAAKVLVDRRCAGSLRPCRARC